MKSLKHLAIMVLVCYGASAMAAPSIFTQKLDRKEVDKIKARAETADLKQVQGDINNLRKHGNVKAAGHIEVIFKRRTLELAKSQAKPSVPAKPSAPVQPPASAQPTPVVAPVETKPTPTKPLTKNQQLDAQVQKLEAELDEMLAKAKRGEISKEELKKYIDENSEAKRQLWSQQTIEL